MSRKVKVLGVPIWEPPVRYKKVNLSHEFVRRLKG